MWDKHLLKTQLLNRIVVIFKNVYRKYWAYPKLGRIA